LVGSGQGREIRVLCKTLPHPPRRRNSRTWLARRAGPVADGTDWEGG